jgi:hypothetical protein
MAYYYKTQSGEFPNKNLSLIKAHHFIMAYHIYTQNKMRLSLESYFQRLYNVPIVPSLTDNYWMLNYSSGFPTFKVVSKGKGRNYGLDLAAEKLFSNSYFVLLTASVLNSSFQPYSRISYNSRFNTNFSSSFTFSKEFKINKGRILQVGGRYMLSGGFRYTPFDPIQSKEKGTYIPLLLSENEGQIPKYKRLDLRIAYRFNGKKVAGNISLDIQNALNTINATGVSYDFSTNTTNIQYRGSGFVPLLSTQFDF